jgi:hypothetical protein
MKKDSQEAGGREAEAQRREEVGIRRALVRALVPGCCVVPRPFLPPPLEIHVSHNLLLEFVFPARHLYG